MSIRKDLARAIEKAQSIPKSNRTVEVAESAVKDVEILLRFAHPTTDQDLVEMANATIAELRGAKLPIATKLRPCAYCGCTILRACNKGRIELSIDKALVGFEAHFIVCSNCGDIRTLTDPEKLPASFAQIEALG